MSFCSPKNNKDNGTCFNNNLLDLIINEYNKQYPDQNIDTHLSNKKKIDLIRKFLKPETGCDEEWCISKSNIFSKYRDEIEESFRPVVPNSWLDKKNTWLNTLDIIECLSQYENAYPEFHFLSVSPIDFDTIIKGNFGYSEACVDEDLCSLELKDQVKTKITKLGAVFNLDKHNQSGSHWVAFFSDLLLGEAYYYDSVANGKPKEVVKFMERISSQYDQLLLSNKIKVKTDYRFKFNLKSDNIIDTNHFKFPLSELCNWMIRDDHFMLYRFSSFRKKNASLWKSKQFNIKKNDELIKRVLSQVISVIDITNKLRYASVPNIDKLLSNFKDGKIDTNTFTENWADSQIKIAINKFMSTLKIFSINGVYKNIRSMNIDENGKIIIELEDGNITDECTVIDCSFKLFENYVQHQFKNTECGMYSINFIDHMLVSSKNFHDVILNPIDDDNMNNLRYSKYFRPND
jgi:hypothetical protein